MEIEQQSINRKNSVSIYNHQNVSYIKEESFFKHASSEKQFIKEETKKNKKKKEKQ